MFWIFILLLFVVPSFGQDFPNCDAEFGFQISQTCCCTQNCCSYAAPGEFIRLPSGKYKSTVTGQELDRTGWSVNRRTIKCACTLVSAGVWEKRPDSRVSCLFVPLPIGSLLTNPSQGRLSTVR